MKQIILNQEEMVKKAKAAFKDFKEAIKEHTGSTIDPSSEPILENVFMNGYMMGVDDLVRMSETTDQKAIDIEKAIKAHCSFCEAHNACVDRGGFCCPETEHIKKKMEEL